MPLKKFMKNIRTIPKRTWYECKRQDGDYWQAISGGVEDIKAC